MYSAMISFISIDLYTSINIVVGIRILGATPPPHIGVRK